MTRLIIICEGPTEREFVRELLKPHLTQFDICVVPPLIKKSGGGIVPWKVLKKQIEQHLKERGAWVTTFIDFYGIKPGYDYPGWQEMEKIQDAFQKVKLLEERMLQDLNDGAPTRFIPYYQLHEFEGLLFNNIGSFDSEFPDLLNNRSELVDLIRKYPNPELINNGLQTAPSKRMAKFIKGYNKVLYGNILAQNIGLYRIRQKCIHFDAWLKKLEGLE